MFSFKSVYFVIFTLILWDTQAEISDKRLCIDENCSELIAVAKTLIRYASPEHNVLSFAPNEDVKIFSYGAGKRPDLIGVEIKGRRGYVNKGHVRETDLKKRPQLLVDTELVQNNPEVPLQGAASDIKADPTQQPFEVVDGTRIPLDLEAFSTEVPILSDLKEESNLPSTKPLHSVPENHNINQATQPPAVKTDEKIDKETKVGSQLDDNDDEDDDSDGDDEDDDDEEEHDGDEESDAEKTQVKKLENESLKINETSANLPSNVPVNDDVKERVDNLTNIETKNKEALITNEPNAQSTNETNPLKNSQPIEITDKSESINATEPIEIANFIKTEANTDKQKEHIESSDGLELKVGESAPVLNESSAIHVDPPIVASTIIPSDDPSKNESQTDSPFGSTENISVDSPEEMAKHQSLGEIKESIPSEADPSLPLPTTENPIEIEPLPPVDEYSVTPNPLDDKNVEQPSSEDLKPPKYDLPSSLMPEFKDPEETAEVKVEETAGGGILGGLGGLLPIFNSGEDRDDSTSVTPAEEAITPMDESSNQNYLDSSVNTLEDNPLTNENNLQKSDEEFIKDSETNIYNEPSSSFMSGITSFFGLSDANVKSDKTPEDSQDVSSTDLNANNLGESKGADIDPNINESSNMHNPWSSDTISEQVNEEVEVCDSKYKKCSENTKDGVCDLEKEDCPEYRKDNIPHHEDTFSKRITSEDLQEIFIGAFSSDMFLYLITTSLSVLVLIFVWILLDKCRREGPLIARINKLEQQLLATSKENEMLQEKATLFVEEKTQLVVETVPNEVVDELNSKLAEMSREKISLEEQMLALEKELDTSTEVGIELNKLISEMLNSTDGSEILKDNIEQMQKRVLEQQDTIHSLNERLNLKETENYEFQLELEISNKKISDLKGELNKMVEKILKIEEEKDQQHSSSESEILGYQNKCKEALTQEHTLKSEVIALKQKVAELQRIADTKIKEYGTLKETLNTIKSVKNNKEALKSFLDVSEIKAQLEQMKSENLKYSQQLSQERESNISYTTQIQDLSQEAKKLREKFEKADKEKVEINTKLEVLNNYFKEKEDQMQKEISKYESLWAVKEGEATSTTERIRYMQEELQNFKAQNESLKQEIVNQEVELKSQISMLEKKSHENWVTNRQTERKLEEARQEAALLRNRLTMRERAIAEGNNQIRMQSPLHQNGELPLSPPPLDPTQSPPPLFNPRDHMTKSPPISGMPPPPFLPPPLGATPFMPPPPLESMMHPPLGDIGGMPPFIPGLHPGMFPGDHRPPPLGRMSSPPPVGGRYTPESTVYSEYDRYDRRSPSPPYDSEYGASPPIRGYSPYDDRDRDRLRDDRREYKRHQTRSNGRNSKGVHSSGSENDSLGKVNKKPQRKV